MPIDPLNKLAIGEFLFVKTYGAGFGEVCQQHRDAVKAVEHMKGVIVECGTGSGAHTKVIAEATDQGRVFGFDCWMGLPEDWDMGERIWKKGSMRHAIPVGLPNNVILCGGLFEDSLPLFAQRLEREKQTIRYLSIDCDLYSSAKTVFDWLGWLLVPGSLVYLDEACDWGGGPDRYPNWPKGEWLALCEWLYRSGHECEAFSRNCRYGACVRITK